MQIISLLVRRLGTILRCLGKKVFMDFSKFFNPTSSQISAPSLAPINTSNWFFEFFGVQTFPLWSYRIILIACIIASISVAAMLCPFKCFSQ